MFFDSCKSDFGYVYFRGALKNIPLVILIYVNVFLIIWLLDVVWCGGQDTMAASLSALLAHPSYGVRFEAAVALASLGSALPWCAAGLLQQVNLEGIDY